MKEVQRDDAGAGRDVTGDRWGACVWVCDLSRGGAYGCGLACKTVSGLKEERGNPLFLIGGTVSIKYVSTVPSFL